MPIKIGISIFQELFLQTDICNKTETIKSESRKSNEK